MVFSIMIKHKLLQKNLANSRLECKKHTLFMTKLAELNTLFMNKIKWLKNQPFGTAHNYIASIKI